LPSRTSFQSLTRRTFQRWPIAQHTAFRLLDIVYRVVLRPFRRSRVSGRAMEAASLVAKTAAYNEAAERYFATVADPRFLLDKPFSDTALAGKHLIDVGVLIDAMRLKPGDVVAEIGAGSCWLSHMLNRFGCRTISVDVSPTAIALGQQVFERDPRTNWELDPAFIAYDGRHLPIEDASCDRIVINDAFHHIPNQRELLREMHRVLRGDGVVAMSEPGYGHAAAAHSVAEAESGVLENELVLEDVVALAEDVGFREATVVVASPVIRQEIAARDLGAFMGGKGFAAYWKALCSGLEQHHYIVLHKGPAEPTTRRPARLTARIEPLGADGVLSLRAGARPSIELRITNLGDTRWLAGPHVGNGWTRLGAHLYRAGPPRDLIDFDWVRFDLLHDVAPGTRITIDAELPAIEETGDYLVVFDLVVEGLTWFADRGSSPASLNIRIRAS
jgi:SAM-dependent methyltransferase